MKIGIALSGGGVRGIAHLGVLKALNEHGVFPDQIAGVSAGGIVGAFIAAGYKPDEVIEIIQKTSLFKFLRPGISRNGLLKLEYAEALLKQYFPENSFSSLKTKLIVAAVGIRNGRINYFEEGDLIMPLLASASIPVIFNPITINGEQYFDGGLVENLPVTPLKNTTDFVIGVHSNPINEDYQKLSMKAFIERIFLLAINGNARHSMKLLDFLIEPEELKFIRWSDSRKAKDIFSIGYRHTINLIPQLLERLNKV